MGDEVPSVDRVLSLLEECEELAFFLYVAAYRLRNQPGTRTLRIAAQAVEPGERLVVDASGDDVALGHFLLTASALASSRAIILSNSAMASSCSTNLPASRSS